MTWSTTLWLLWGLMFVVVETVAIIRPEGGDTLSEHLRLWFSTKGRGRWWIARRLLLAAFFLWFIPHLFLDGPGPL